MESPDFLHLKFHRDGNMSFKKITPEDSGYITTPNSSESTRLGAEYSSSISHRQLSYRVEKSIAGSSRSCSMPIYDTNLERSFINRENCVETGVSFLDTPNGFMSSTRICPPSYEKYPRTNKLERTDALEMDWSPSESGIEVTRHGIESADTGHFTSGLFSGLLISDDYVKDDSKNVHETPKKHKISSASIIIKSQRPSKKPGFLQKLGTPEKNEILYRNLISVTPKKFVKSPEMSSPPKKEKIVFTKENIRENWRPLSFKNDYSGFKNIDFMRLLERFGVPTKILSFLSDEDLYSTSQVSEKWRSVCFGDEKLRNRIIEYKNLMEINKENLLSIESKECANKVNRRIDSNKNSIELADIHNVLNIIPEQNSRKSPPVSPGKRRFIMFTKVNISKKLVC